VSKLRRIYKPLLASVSTFLLSTQDPTIADHLLDHHRRRRPDHLLPARRRRHRHHDHPSLSLVNSDPLAWPQNELHQQLGDPQSTEPPRIQKP
jgi:hypothetical protein